MLLHTHTLSSVKTALRAGAKPEEIGACIGGGCDRSAYAVGPFVVKAAPGILNERSEKVYATFKALGLRRAPTVTVEGPEDTWEIQLRYRLMEGEEISTYYQSPVYKDGLTDLLDVHTGNVGYDRKGRLVVWDW